MFTLKKQRRIEGETPRERFLKIDGTGRTALADSAKESARQERDHAARPADTLHVSP
ncbi:hypothetical protein J2X68_001125 [Streptomyces sp. 3330]|uniref:hypothetical protein n=1 Tax=Streptomyces sp. 3330 TaxID=2817755 RepID=UPI002866FA17|nr:hypothetical protein [Streptomyces sp. 3330]MDR6974447.1 hypothetical protein [Streptomyces sp. 3330]